MDKTCVEIRDLMALGGDASANERIAIESHVSVCSECARELAESRQLTGNLALLREGDMPSGAAERIWRGVQSAVPQPRRSVFMTWSIRAAAALLLGVSVGFTFSTVNRNPVSTPALSSTLSDDTRPTVVPTAKEAYFPSPAPQEFPTVRPTPPAIEHCLPFVEKIFEQDTVRF